MRIDAPPHVDDEREAERQKKKEVETIPDLGGLCYANGPICALHV